ncbi:helix-turn-helix transcriptional regulator [Thermoleophilia bacterium SCSIO 60948]|nr:helix-turn-helix transcriptional regulator [Thermoleophilia bacterium SCSIO 60948]
MRFWREAKGLTLGDLSDETGVSKVFLNNVERGRKQPSLKTAQAIASALDVPVDEVFRDEAVPTPREIVLRWNDNFREKRAAR